VGWSFIVNHNVECLAEEVTFYTLKKKTLKHLQKETLVGNIVSSVSPLNW